MGKEREITILDVKKGEVIKRLKELKAKHVGTHNFARVECIIDGKPGIGRHSWIRIRTDGKETTLALKKMRGKGGFTAMDEYEVKTDDFEETVRIVGKLLNLKKGIYFENERVAYTLKGAYITIDKWPELPYSVEIEAPSTRVLKEVYKLLKINGKFVGNAAIHDVYKRYGLDFREVMDKNKSKLNALLDA